MSTFSGVTVKRASYRAAVQWIALNDSAGDDDALDVESVSGYITTALVADVFGVDATRVGKDVVRARARERERSQ